MLKPDAFESASFARRSPGLSAWVAAVRILFVVVPLLLLGGLADAKTLYVNGARPTGGNGSSWANAFKYLRDALDTSNPGDSIYVAQGVYYPDDGDSGFFGDRELFFDLDGVKLYGGFVGTETNLSQRDPVNNVTVLSGEIWAITPETQGYERYWSLHVVNLKGNSTIDGFTIEKGRANGDEAPNNQGGGVYVPAGFTVTLENCILRQNLACESGGAVWGTVIAKNTVFTENEVDNEFLKIPVKAQRAWIFNEDCYGGAINGDVTAEDCKFIDNIVNTSSLRSTTTTSANGGAINGTTINLKGCEFEGNRAVSVSFHRGDGSAATSRGGAITGGIITVSNSIFTNNLASATSDSAFTPNPDGKTAAAPHTSKPTTLGGAISGQIKAVNTTFADNLTLSVSVEGDNTNNLSFGGALYVEGDSYTVGCSFVRNDSTMQIEPDVDGRPNNIPSGSGGGAVYATSTAVMPVTNCTFLDNTTTGNGTALNINGTVNVLSNIFWSTAVGDVLIWVNANSAKARISNRLYPTPSTETINVVKGGIDGLDIIQSNADFGEPPERTLLDPTEPVLVDETDPEGPDGIFGTEDDGLRLATASAAIGKGHPLFIPTDTLDVDEDGNVTELLPTDVAGYARVQDTTLDLGAYEFGDIILSPEIQVEQPAGQTLVDGTSTVNFAASPSVPAVRTFVIKNVGSMPLKQIAVTKSGPDSDEFVISQPVTKLGAAGSTTFTVTFAPGGTGLKTAMLHILSNDRDENPFDINVQGERQVPDIVVEYPDGVDLTDNVSTVNYGTVSALSSVTKVFTIRNIGLGNLNIKDISVAGANRSEFKVNQPASGLLTTGATTTFKVTFSPTTAGSKSASINVNSNDPDAESTFTIRVAGNSTVTPEIEVDVASSGLSDGGTANFGAVKKGLSYTRVFTIKNVGSSNLKNISASLTGSTNFSKTKLKTTTLQPGKSTKISVTFKPSSTGDKQGKLQIFSNDANESPFDITLKGEGIPVNSSAKKKSALVAGGSSKGSDSAGTVSKTKDADGLKYKVLTVVKTPGCSISASDVEVSSNLVDWFSGKRHTTVLEDDSDILRVRDNTPVEKGAKRYIRLK